MDEEADVAFRFLPGHYFFCRTLALPEEVNGGEELFSFAELSLESLSPFPLEQLAWGYLVDEAARLVFLFAACRPRLPAEALEGWEEAQHVFPSFLPLLLRSPAEPGIVAIEDETTLSLLNFEGQSRFPKQVLSAPLPEEATLEDMEALRRRLLVRLKPSAQESELVVFKPRKVSGDSEALTFELAKEGREEFEEVRLEGEETVWAADVREPEFIVAERRRRKASQRVGIALAAAGGAAGLLVLLVLLTWLGGWLVSRREALVMEQDPMVYGIQQSSDFLLQLEQFSGAPFRPFTILAAANKVLQERQPRHIEFTSAALSNNNEVSIRGEADNVEEVNRYSESLRQSNYFTEVILDDVRTRGGKVNFSLNLRFNPDSLEELLAQPEPEPEAVAANDTETTTDETIEPETATPEESP